MQMQYRIVDGAEILTDPAPAMAPGKAGKSGLRPRVSMHPKWQALSDACGGLSVIAAYVGVHYQTVWRWAYREGRPMGSAVRAVQRMAEEFGVPNPLE